MTQQKIIQFTKIDIIPDGLTASLAEMISQGVTEGADRGVMRAAHYLPLDLSPSKENPEVLDNFKAFLFAEYPCYKEYKFPFKNSLKSIIDSMVFKNHDVFLALYGAKMDTQVRVVANFIGIRSVVRFLKLNRVDAVITLSYLKHPDVGY